MKLKLFLVFISHVMGNCEFQRRLSLFFPLYKPTDCIDEGSKLEFQVGSADLAFIWKRDDKYTQLEMLSKNADIANVRELDFLSNDEFLKEILQVHFQINVISIFWVKDRFFEIDHSEYRFGFAELDKVLRFFSLQILRNSRFYIYSVISYENDGQLPSITFFEDKIQSTFINPQSKVLKQGCYHYEYKKCPEKPSEFVSECGFLFDKDKIIDVRIIIQFLALNKVIVDVIPLDLKDNTISVDSPLFKYEPEKMKEFHRDAYTLLLRPLTQRNFHVRIKDGPAFTAEVRDKVSRKLKLLCFQRPVKASCKDKPSPCEILSLRYFCNYLR